MRVPKPDLLKLTKENLWKMLEHAWEKSTQIIKKKVSMTQRIQMGYFRTGRHLLVELLSEQLDRYPYHLVQEFVHMMGGAIHPSLPSIGVVTVEPAESGMMENSPIRPAPWRFLRCKQKN